MDAFITRRVATEADLARAGFTSTQIARLVNLRASYPYIEWTTSLQEWHQLCFLKWRVQVGRIGSPTYPLSASHASSPPMS